MVATGKRTSPGFWFGLHVRPSLSRKVLFDNSCATFTPALSSRCPKFSTSSKAVATRSFMWFRQPRTDRKPRLPRSNGMPAPGPSSKRVHRKCAHRAKDYLAAMGRSPSRNESLSFERRVAVACVIDRKARLCCDGGGSSSTQLDFSICLLQELPSQSNDLSKLSWGLSRRTAA